jgi:glyceraldehyde 3-phosphate dehydrogenase
MSTLKIGINGFGRIGRKVFRLALNNPQIEITAINDLGDIRTLAHLLKYDSVHGTIKEDVTVEGQTLVVGGRKVKCTSERDVSKLPWATVGAQIIHECTGAFTDREHASMHLKAGAKKVIISAPAKNPDITICMGVNHKNYNHSHHHIISNASCTTNCLAPLVKVMDDSFGLVRGTMLTVHSYTNDQRILDLPHKDLRRARAAAVSMIPTSTGAAKAVGEVLPHLKGKLDGLSIRVPTPNVSLVDFTFEINKDATKDQINQAFKTAASTGDLKNILAVSDAPLVSTDYNGNIFSSTVDLELTNVVQGKFVKVISWYDNESGFSQRMIDLSVMIAQ